MSNLNVKTRNENIDAILSRGVQEIINREHLESALRSGKKLRVKFGIDPTSAEVHLGHTVPLRKLRQFQEAGHRVVLIIGDFTAMIGDPSGRSEARKPLSKKEVRQNMKTYLKQIGLVLDLKRLEIRYNSEWLAKPSLIPEISALVTVQQVLEREDFQKRIEEENPITLRELLYPLLQGYDSVAVRADIEIGGTDQKFNLLMGRRLQRQFGLPEQDIMTLPLLEGTDGIRKMSKSFGNVISLRASARDMFGKIMSIPDALIGKYFELLTDITPDPTLSPRDAKLLLARTIVAMYRGAKASKAAEDEFIRVFSKKELPHNLAEVYLSRSTMTIVDAVLEVGFAKSRSEARRLVVQGAVRINDFVQRNPNEFVSFSGGEIMRVGKRRFAKIQVGRQI